MGVFGRRVVAGGAGKIRKQSRKAEVAGDATKKKCERESRERSMSLKRFINPKNLRGLGWPGLLFSVPKFR